MVCDVTREYLVFIRGSGSMKNGPWTLECHTYCTSQPTPTSWLAIFSVQPIMLKPCMYNPIISPLLTVFMVPEPLKTCTFKTIATIYTVMQRIPDAWDMLHHRCKKPWKSQLSVFNSTYYLAHGHQTFLWQTATPIIVGWFVAHMCKNS